MKNTKKLGFAVLILIILFIGSYIILNFEEISNSRFFTGFSILGTRLLITETFVSSCNISFEQGWNLVSFYCLSSDVNKELFFENISFNYTSIRMYDASDKSDPWKTYNPSLPNWTVQDDMRISREKGYWIYVESNKTFFKEGDLKSPTLINLEQGWNLIGFPSINKKDINETFGDLIPRFDYVYMYNSSNLSWNHWTWNTSLTSDQDLEITYPGYGYWIYMLEPYFLQIG